MLNGATFSCRNVWFFSLSMGSDAHFGLGWKCSQCTRFCNKCLKDFNWVPFLWMGKTSIHMLIVFNRWSVRRWFVMRALRNILRWTSKVAVVILMNINGIHSKIRFGMSKLSCVYSLCRFKLSWTMCKYRVQVSLKSKLLSNYLRFFLKR